VPVRAFNDERDARPGKREAGVTQLTL